MLSAPRLGKLSVKTAGKTSGKQYFITSRHARLDLNLEVHLPAVTTEHMATGQAKHVIHNTFLHAHWANEVLRSFGFLQR